MAAAPRRKRSRCETRWRGKALRDARDQAVRALLTPEQQARFDAMKALREDGGPMGGGGPKGRHGTRSQGPGGLSPDEAKPSP